MASVHVEVETKYEVDAGFQVPGLVELFGEVRGEAGTPAADGAPWAEGEAVEHRLQATYVDTEDLRLARAGLTLRRRTGGEDAGWHLKVPAADGARSEVRVPLGEAEEPVPQQLVAMTYAVTGGRPLVPVARIETHRTVRRLVDATGDVLVEVADDRVSAQRLHPDGSGDATTPAQTWREVEVELVDGPRGLVDAVAPVLRERGLTPARTTSKLQRALGADAAAGNGWDTGGAAGTHGAASTDGRSGQPSRRASATASDVVLEYVGTQVSQIRSQDLYVRLDAPGAVHAMRVATRRLRSGLTTFEPLFRSAVTRPVRRELKWLAGVLGAARDAEVMRDRVVTSVREESPEALLGAGVDDEVATRLESAYRTAHEGVLAELDTPRYRALLDTLGSLLDHPPLKERAARPAKEELGRLVRRSYAELRDTVKAARRTPDPQEREELLHDARKAAKRARYAGESAVPASGQDAKRFAAAMESVQETLGEHLESLNARAHLLALAEQTSSPSAAFTLGRLHALEEVRAERSEQDVDTAWAAASRKRLRRWLD